jgi:hypothetical protein
VTPRGSSQPVVTCMHQAVAPPIPKRLRSAESRELRQELTALSPSRLVCDFLLLLDEMLDNPAVGGFDAAGRDLRDRSEGWVPM